MKDKDDRQKSSIREEGVSRRSFLKGASLAAVGGAGVALFGCASQPNGATSSSSQSSSTGTSQAPTNDVWTIKALPEPTETVQADVAIIGGGGTGCAAAIQAKQLGLEPIVVDCGKKWGGSFIGTEGMFGVQTHWNKEAGENTTVEQIVGQCMTYHHWIPLHGLYMNFFNQTADTVEWLEALGVQFRDVVRLGNSGIFWHVYQRTDKRSPGATFMESFGKAADALGVNARFDTFARKLVIEGGKVAGLLCENPDGSTLKIETKAVIIGSGGYSTNTDMIYELAELQNENIFSVGAEKRDGDGLKMAKDAGAAFAESPGTVMWCGPWIMGATWGTNGYSASVQPTLWVNEKAERFVNEDLWLTDFAAAGIAMRNQKKTYAIMTDADIERFETVGPDGAVFTFAQVGTPMPDVRSQLQDLDSVHIGDDLAALAKEVGLDPTALNATVDKYNSYCANGDDTDFGKGKDFLRPIQTGPYWLCEIADGYYTTCGGIKINENTEVLDTQGNAIGGLYAGGSDAGGLYGDSYDVSRTPGSQASWAVNSGRMAAKMAADYLK